MDYKIYIRLMQGEEIALGPGKADLMSAIIECGSLSKAAKSLSISYKRAWSMVDAINRGFKTPLIILQKGGASGGGAKLSPEGVFVLQHYRACQSETNAIVSKFFEQIQHLTAE